MPIEASNNVRDFVLPVCNVDHNGQGVAIRDRSSLIGTCFLIGKRGYALTAAHVLHQVNQNLACVLVRDSEGWVACPIDDAEPHPTEDIGILKIDLPAPVTSPIVFSKDEPHPGLEYNMWAFPEVVAKEVLQHENWPADAPDFNPSAVYFRGYIRRKLPYSPNPSFSIYVGTSFYEVSEIAGACCSGAPLSTMENYPRVFGIYIGEENTSRRCGYAANLTRFVDWIPECLGKPISSEIIGPWDDV